MKNVFSDVKGKVSENIVKVPEKFHEAAGRFVRIVRDELGSNEVRALAADKVASPVLQVRKIGAIDAFPPRVDYFELWSIDPPRSRG